jgi:hypothetical protein
MLPARCTEEPNLPTVAGLLTAAGRATSLRKNLPCLGYKAKDAIGELAGQQIRMQVEDSLNADPNFSSNIGTIETMSMDLMATGEANQGNQGAQGQNTWMVFNVTGSNGSGVLKVRTGQSQNEFTEAVLVLPDGQELPVEIASSGSDPTTDAPEFDTGETFLPSDGQPLQLDPQ